MQKKALPFANICILLNSFYIFSVFLLWCNNVTNMYRLPNNLHEMLVREIHRKHRYQVACTEINILNLLFSVNSDFQTRCVATTISALFKFYVLTKLALLKPVIVFTCCFYYNAEDMGSVTCHHTAALSNQYSVRYQKKLTTDKKSTVGYYPGWNTYHLLLAL